MKAKFATPLMSSLFVVATCSHAMDWIGLEPDPRMTLGFELAQDEQSNNSKSFFINKPISAFDITLAYSHEAISEFDESFDSHRYFAQLGGELSDATYAAFSYQFQGNQDELENEQFELLLDYSPYPASISFGLMSGDTHFFTSEAIRAVRDIPAKVSSDIQSYTLGFGWWFENYRLSAKHQSYDYQRDLSVLSTRPVLQLLVKPAALAQSGLLVTEQSSISLSYPLVGRTLSGHILRSRSALDKTRSQSLQFDWIEQINQDTDVTLALIFSDDSTNAWSFSAGLTWQV